MTASTGTSGCPCIDASAVLASFPDRQCQLPSSSPGDQRQDRPGAMIGPSSSLRACVPLTYGSSSCQQHDLIHDPACAIDLAGEYQVPPRYCFRAWCFVDPDACKQNSEEVLYGSYYFADRASGSAAAFYSYSTCNSTAEDWLDYVHDKEKHLLGGVVITASIPEYTFPMHYKRDPASSSPLSVAGDEYYDHGVPYQGIYPRYMKELVKLSDGDIKDVVYTHRSRASESLHPTSNFTAIVEDIENGLYDMGVGAFWVTSKRLSMTPFTTPFDYDENYLVVPRQVESLEQEVIKVLSPFTWGAWACILAVIFLSAMLSVWFSDPALEPPQTDPMRSRTTSPQRRNKVAYARLFADQILEKGTFFCSAGIEQDRGSSFPLRVMTLGFAFFILVSVAAYIANFAALLTLPMSGGIVSIEAAINSGVTICAHPVIREELEIAHPKANFYFDEKENMLGMIDNFAEEKCGALVLGWERNTVDAEMREALCKNNLVFTDSLVMEIPEAFPISPKLATGVSYWITEAERFHDISPKKMTDKYLEELNKGAKCPLTTSDRKEENKITARNLFFPIIFFGSCVVLAIILQFVHLHLRDRRWHLLGRTSWVIFTERHDARCADEEDDMEQQSSRERGDDLIDERRETSAQFSLSPSQRGLTENEADSFIENGDANGFSSREDCPDPDCRKTVQMSLTPPQRDTHEDCPDPDCRKTVQMSLTPPQRDTHDETKEELLAESHETCVVGLK